MNQKITIQQFAELVSRNTSYTPQQLHELLKVIFRVVTEQLHEGQEANIDQLGTFKLSKDTDQRVAFIPDARLADAVNAPFVSFAPVQLSASYAEESVDPAIEEATSEVLTTEEPAAEESEAAPQPETEETHATEIEPEITPAPELEPIEEPETIEEPEPIEEPIEEPVFEPEQPVPMPEPPPFDPMRAYAKPAYLPHQDEEIFVPAYRPPTKSKTSNFLMGMAVGVVITIALAVLCFFVYEMFINGGSIEVSF